MGKGLIYSCMVGARSTILPVKVREDGVDHLMFTDNQLEAKGKGWKVIPVKKSRTGEHRAQSRVYKWDIEKLPHGYDWVLWIDSTHMPAIPLKETVENIWLKDLDVAAFPHPIRACAFDEIGACLSRGKETRGSLGKAREYLVKHSAKPKSGLHALGIVVRKVCRAQIELGRDLLVPLLNITPRDQIFFDPMRLGRGIVCHDITHGSVYSSEFFTYHGPHG